MNNPQISLADDTLSHEPDFSFRTNGKAKPKFTFDRQPDINLEAGANLTPPATAPVPVTQPVSIVAPSLQTAPAPVQQPTPVQVMQIAPAPFSGVSMAAFVLALIGLVTPFIALPVIFSLLAVILGHIGSYRTRRRGQNGAGYAAAGLAIGYATLAITALVAIVIIILAVLTGNMIQYLDNFLKR